MLDPLLEAERTKRVTVDHRHRVPLGPTAHQCRGVQRRPKTTQAEYSLLAVVVRP